MSEPAGVRLRVVMPVHNGIPYVGQALTSVLDDLPPDSEVVVVDDGSTDGTGQVVDRIAAVDGRVRILRNARPSGVSAALNQGIGAPGTSEFVAVADHDDVVLPGRFAAQLAALEAEPGLGAVSSEGRHIGPNGRVVGRLAVGPTSHEDFIAMRSRAQEIHIPHPAVTYRRRALDDAGLYDPTFDSAQDTELMNRLVYSAGWEARRLRTPHVLYRIHDSSMSFSRMSTQRSISRYIAYRNRRQVDGLPVPSYERWTVAHRPDRRTEWRWRRHDRGALLYRRAGLDWISGRPLRFAVHLTAAAVLHPRWVRMKVGIVRGRTA
jgi:glycosyltransferase involved in cell wall biosynthesis